MSTIGDFATSKYEDGILTIDMTPPVPIGGWEIDFKLIYRFGSNTNIAYKITNSGYGNGVSGITIINSGQGVYNVAINSVDTSGLQFGNYAFQSSRLTSGSRTLLTEGFLVLTPG